MLPQFPIYLPTKGRHSVRLTSKYLSYLKIPHHLVVEEQEANLYREAIKGNAYPKVVVLDRKYQDEYDTFDTLGDTKSKGPGPARNFAWDHSISEGHKWHWVMDDNLRSFRRTHKNRQIKVSDGSIFRAMEDFSLRYINLYMAGPQYMMFLPSKYKRKPVVFNTRIYSCNLIRNDIPYRWRGRYNEDTDISLRILKDGFCTAQFNAFLQEKTVTQAMKGGNSSEFYDKEGTYNKTKMQCDMHPDVSKMMHRWGRIHHFVDYEPFKANKLIRREDIDWDKITEKPNNYDMNLREKGEEDVLSPNRMT
jgi:hypothetical protein